MNCLIETNNNSCFSNKQLLSILLGLQRYFKKYYPKYIIRIDSTNSDILQEKIRKCIMIIYKKGVQESEYINMDFFRFIKDSNVRHDIKFFVFKPHIDMTSPLTTFEIKQIMLKWTKLNINIYFDVGSCDLYKRIDFELLRNYKYNAFVLNLDNSKLPGSHWIAIFTDTYTIEYFDSEGNGVANKCLQIFIRKLQKLYPSKKVVYNKNKFQRSGVNCGVFSIFFIIQRLLGKSFTQVTNHIIDERKIVLYRKLLLS
jgi:hypothetical protein